MWYFQAFTLNLKLETRQRPINPVFKKWTLENWQKWYLFEYGSFWDNLFKFDHRAAKFRTKLVEIDPAVKATSTPQHFFTGLISKCPFCNGVVCNMDFDIRLENGGPKARFLIKKNTKNVGKYRDFYLKWYFRNNLSVILNYIKLIY